MESTSTKRVGLRLVVLLVSVAALVGIAPHVVGDDEAPALVREQKPIEAASTFDQRSGSATSESAPRQITFDDLRLGTHATDKKIDWSAEELRKIPELAGEKITIAGYILPSFNEKMSKFFLVRDNQRMSYGPRMPVDEIIPVSMKEGEEASFTVKKVIVTGVFDLEPVVGPTGDLYCIYEISHAQVEIAKEVTVLDPRLAGDR